MPNNNLYNTAHWDHSFKDGGMFKQGNMGKAIYVEPEKRFLWLLF